MDRRDHRFWSHVRVSYICMCWTYGNGNNEISFYFNFNQICSLFYFSFFVWKKYIRLNWLCCVVCHWDFPVLARKRKCYDKKLHPSIFSKPETISIHSSLFALYNSRAQSIYFIDILCERYLFLYTYTLINFIQSPVI